MKIKNENRDFFSKVYEIVKLIPEGKVTTYGLIAQSIGIKSSARMVGWALNAVAGDMSIPCHRVVNRNGELSGKRYFATPNMMQEMLESEGIMVIDNKIDIKKYIWLPEII
jgi:methylated-DNA-protein-cysteine methyltransferase-like protein